MSIDKKVEGISKEMLDKIFIPYPGGFDYKKVTDRSNEKIKKVDFVTVDLEVKVPNKLMIDGQHKVKESGT